MFRVRFTPEAKAEVARQAQRGGFTKPGVMIHRQGLKGDVVRTAGGQVSWTVERPHPWRAQVGDFKALGRAATDAVFNVDGIAVFLVLVPRPGEVGVQVSLLDGDLYVESLAA
jgi:hypothetical protein